MKIERTMPPVANPVAAGELLSGLLSLSGDRHARRFEEELKGYFGTSDVFILNSGKAALTVILMALKRLCPERGTVVIPAYTCFSVPSAVLKAGLRIRLADVETTGFGFDPRSLASAVDEDTLSIVPNHLFGIPAKMDHVMETAGRYGAYVVEDAAQSMGGHYRGRKLGTIGDAAFFSLGRGKNITCGSGGVILTSNGEIARAARELCSPLSSPGPLRAFKDLIKVAVMNVFMSPSLYWLPLSIPPLRLGETIFYKDFPIERLSNSGCALMRRWVERLERANRRRLRLSELYIDRLGLRPRLRECRPFLRLPLLFNSTEERDHFYKATKRYGVSLMYPSPVSEIPEIRDAFAGESYPAAERIARTLALLPTHGLVTSKEIDGIVNAYNRLISKGYPVRDEAGQKNEACHNN